MSFRPLSTTAGGTQALVQALSDSRERWHMLARCCADLAFETDQAGRFATLEPERVLGWPAQRLIGTPAGALLMGHDDPAAGALLNAFRAEGPVRRRRVWLRDAEGAPACLLMSAVPVPGRPGAMRGFGIDVTEQEQHDSRTAAAMLRLEATRALVLEMRRVAIPFESLAVGLEALIQAVDAQGGALILHEHGAPLRVAAKAGQPWPATLQTLHEAVLAVCEQPATWLPETVQQDLVCGQSLLLCGSANHFVDRAMLALWREAPARDVPASAGGASWSEQESELAASLLQAMQPILEHEQIQRETARVSRTDVLTGLFNRQGFVAELTRRFERLDREALTATLMVVGVDGLAAINAASGIERGDAILRSTAASLRDLVRPTDLVGRLGGDLFALWLDGADQFTAAERADGLRRAGVSLEDEPGSLLNGDPARITVSIGLAVRLGRSFESLESLLHRAWAAMRAVKQRGGSGWQVSDQEPGP